MNGIYKSQKTTPEYGHSLQNYVEVVVMDVLGLEKKCKRSR